jgi:hypothetical protein
MRTDIRYPEEEARRWLGWLARGMTKHSQSVFLIEQLQPDWLEDEGQIWCYLLISRVLQAIIGSGLMAFGWELISAFGEDGFGWRALPRHLISNLFHRPDLVLLVLGLGLVFAVAEGLVKARDREISAPVAWLICSGVLVAFISQFLKADEVFVCSTCILIAIRGARPCSRDIQPAERLAWSWKDFAGGLMLIGILPKIPERSLDPAAHDRLVWKVWLGRAAIVLYNGAALALFLLLLAMSLFLTGIVSLLFGNRDLHIFSRIADIAALVLFPNLVNGFFQATSRKVVEMNSRPNAAIRNSILISAPFPLAAFILAAAAAMNSDRFLFLPWVLVIFGVAAGGWFGGMDAIAHYTLRFVMRLFGHAPLNYPRFLDYASTELGFLQKVGGGYVFMHRYLKEYFAAEEASVIISTK